MGAKPRNGLAGVERTYQMVRRMAGVAPPATAVPRRSGAVVLVRERAEIEVFLVRRATTLEFLGGYWSFPGGSTDGAENASDAARRELAEETGVVLDPGAELAPLGRWITPANVPIRFDTDYYAARADGQVPDIAASRGELDAGEWVTPATALARLRAGEWLIPSPVRRVLELLEGGVDAAVAGAAVAVAAEDAAHRIWNIAGAVDVSPLRTPTLPPATHTNCYILGARDMVIVDPATPYDDERAEIDRVLAAEIAGGRRPVAVWLTHHHNDHIGDAARLSARHRIPVAAHPETARRVAGTVEVSRLLRDGDRLELAGDPPRVLRCVFTPGHAPGHLCFYEERTRLMVAGDMVAGIGTILIDPSEGDMGEYLSSLALIRGLEPRRLLPAHGPILVDPAAAIDRYVAHRLWREARVRAALEASAGPATAAALVPAAYADVSPAIYPLAERSLIAHLVKLERDGAAERVGPRWRAATA